MNILTDIDNNILIYVWFMNFSWFKEIIFILLIYPQAWIMPWISANRFHLKQNKINIYNNRYFFKRESVFFCFSLQYKFQQLASHNIRCYRKRINAIYLFEKKPRKILVSIPLDCVINSFSVANFLRFLDLFWITQNMFWHNLLCVFVLICIINMCS